MANRLEYSNTAMTNQDLRGVVPAIFAQEAHESRSDNYAFVPTIDVVEALQNEGFRPFLATQTKSKKRPNHTKHMLRFRHDSLMSVQVGEFLPEVILINSHDGSARFTLFSGVCRLACLNGMLISIGADESFSIRHNKNVVQGVLDASFEIIARVGEIASRVDDMKSITLDRVSLNKFADDAAVLKFKDRPITIEPQQLLVPRREQDTSKDLWTTMNVIQENLMRGGVVGKSTTNQRTTTRDIRDIDENMRINSGLWRLAQGMMPQAA